MRGCAQETRCMIGGQNEVQSNRTTTHCIVGGNHHLVYYFLVCGDWRADERNCGEEYRRDDKYSV